MSYIKTLRNHRQFTTELKELVEISQEVSVLNMQRVRTSILAARKYMEGIMDIFSDIRQARQKHIQEILNKGKSPRTLLSTGRKKAVCILLSPSGKFSGPLVKQVFQEYEAYLATHPTDVVVVGEAGRKLVQQYLGPRTQFEYFSINLERQSHEQLEKLLAHILKYENITLFAGKFENLAVQHPAAFNISGYASLKTQQSARTEKRAFLFEPALEHIVSFFDAQVTTTLFRQTLDESKLANLGSRILALENSLSGINHEVTLLDRKLRRVHRRLENRKQSNRISGMSMWA
jgi:F0F1-type ATP synthase gamma subunit